jgi:hypothetical protein
MRKARTELRAQVSSEVKARVRALSERQLISDAVWLRQLVCDALHVAASEETAPSRVTAIVRAAHRAGTLATDCEDAPTTRVYLRLRPEDRLLLRERARARGMRSATYVSVLVRAHLRSLAPLPKDELIALRQSVAELGAIGRNLNQLARAANSGERVAGPAREDLLAMLQVCEAMRAHVKALIRTNVNSWSAGYAEPES